MSSKTLTDKWFDPESVCASIIRENYSEMPIRSIASIVERIRSGFWRIIDDDPRRHVFFIPESEYDRDERGDEFEIGLLVKRTGESKRELSPLEVVEGRTHNDSKKWRFHYGDELLERLPADVLSDYADFLRACKILNDRGREKALRLAESFDAVNRGAKSFPGSLTERMRNGRTLTRLLRYEDTKETNLVLFDHKCQAILSQESDPRHILMFPGTKFWGVTRGHYGTGTVHGVYSKKNAQFDASLHHDRSCMTLHWISKSDTNGHRFAVVTFVHCELYPEDVEWFDAHIHDLKIDRAAYCL